MYHYEKIKTFVLNMSKKLRNPWRINVIKKTSINQ